MKSIENSDTRFFIDIDLKSLKIVKYGSEDRFSMEQKLEFPLHRIFITKGQLNKFEEDLERAKK